MSAGVPDAAAVLALAGRDGQRWVDADVAARIAVGASAAVRAVEAAQATAPSPDPATPEFEAVDAVRAGRALLTELESLAANDA